MDGIPPSDQLLVNCYRNAFRLAEKHDIDSIAFPAISTGAFGYPMKEAAEIAFQTVKDIASELKQVKVIRFVLFGEDDLDLHQKVMNNVFNS